MAGVVVYVFMAVAMLTGEERWYDHSKHRKKQDAYIVFGYAIWLTNLLCLVNFFDWRRGLRDIGLSELWSWVLAPIGLILLIGVSLATFIDFDSHRRRHAWVGELVIFLVYFALFFGYIRVATG